MKSNGGFSLIELMVAMVIGLIIILGAGQLFLTVFQTNRQVETLSEKQAAVNFSVDVLLGDIRRADWSKTTVNADGSELAVTVPNRGDCSSEAEVTKIYSLDSRTVGGEIEYFLEVDLDCTSGGPQELVGGFYANGFVVAPEGDYGVLITLKLVPTNDTGTADVLTFFAVNRTAAVTN